jgi:hypothetical protein
MIFVSYSHADEKWRKRFEIISKPLSRSEGICFWSDRDLKGGEWEPQIQRAMKGAVATVLLVSDNFLASDYIIQKELPYLLKARSERGLMIFWAYLEPCDLKRHPEITNFQAMSLGNLEPMTKMTDWQWKETMVRGCGMIDEFLKDLERPSINAAVVGKSFAMLTEKLPLLNKPARRSVEVLVYSTDRKWWRQWGVTAGQSTTKIQLGNDQTKKGTKFTVVAMTTEQPLKERNFSNLPESRTRSEEITLFRE